MTNAASLRAQVQADLDRNGDLIAKRDEARAAIDRGVTLDDVRASKVQLVSTEEKKQIASTPTESILGKAHRLVQGKRGAAYGHPLDNHGATAAMFAAYLQRKYDLRVPLDADDVCWFNIFQKGSRDANEPGEDNLVDTAGYAFNLELIRGERERRGVGWDY